MKSCAADENDWNDVCDHDFDNPKRIGRANYRCRKCGEDISLSVMMIEENDQAESERKQPKEIKIMGETTGKPSVVSDKSECAGSAYLYNDIDDLATNTDRNDITDRDRYFWRMARLNRPNDNGESSPK